MQLSRSDFEVLHRHKAQQVLRSAWSRAPESARGRVFLSLGLLQLLASARSILSFISCLLNIIEKYFRKLFLIYDAR